MHIDDGTEFTNLDDYAIANKYELLCLFFIVILHQLAEQMLNTY